MRVRDPDLRTECRAIGFWLPSALPRQCAPSSAEHTGDRNQHDSSQESHNETLQVEASHHQVSTEDEATNVAAHNRAEDAQDDVAQETIAAPHELAGKPASHKT